MGAQGVNKRRDTVNSSPFAGCTVILAAILSMLFLVGFVIWNLFKLDSEISKFTSDEAIPTPVSSLVDNTKSLNTLEAKFNNFETTATKGTEEVALSLSAEEINLAIAAYEPFESLRKTFWVKEIKDGRLHIQISYPMRGKPMSDEFRYLNGTQVALPKLLDGEIILQIEQVLVTDATVPKGFLGQLSPHRITAPYKEHEVLGPWMAKLTTVTIVGDQIVLTLNPLVEKAPRGDATDMPTAIRRALLLFGSLLGLLVITLALFFFFLRAKKRARALPPQE
jgi:hypothetical protein